MCFSATASLTAGGALSATGVFTLSKTKDKRQFAFASIPLLFGIQQIIEGYIWLSFSYGLNNVFATYAYSFFSHLFWPIFVPIAVLLVETSPSRRRMLKVFAAIGVIVGLDLLYFMLIGPVTAQVVNHCIAYHSAYEYPILTLIMYVVATCGSCLVSSHKIINYFGFALVISFTIAAWFYEATFFSVWCFFSALLSIFVIWYVFNSRKKRRA